MSARSRSPCPPSRKCSVGELRPPAPPEAYTRRSLHPTPIAEMMMRSIPLTGRSSAARTAAERRRYLGGGSMKNDLDMPLLPSAEQIRRREFATVRRGYDPDQVREYLQGVAGQVETLERELRDQRKESKAQRPPTPGESLAAAVTAGPVTTPVPATPAPTAPPQDPYETIAKRFAGVLESADKEATAALAQAKAEADRVLQEARSEADRIKLDAQARAEQAKQQGTDSLAEAKREAERILGSLSERR